MKNILPVLLLKNLLILPNQEVKLELNNELSKSVVKLASEKYKNEVVVLSPKDQKEEIPEVGDLPTVTVIAKIKSKLELPNGNYRITLRGLFRVQIKELSNDKKMPDILKCHYEKLKVPPYDEIEALAYKKKLRSLVSTYVKYGQGVSNSILNVIKEIEDLNKLTDSITSFLSLSFLQKLSYVEEINPVFRAENLIKELNILLEVTKLEQKLEEKFQNGLAESQKEFILKEKLKSIQEELGESNHHEKEAELYFEKLENLHLKNKKVKEKIQAEIKKFSFMSDASPEITNVRNYLEWMLALPWHIESKEEEDLKAIEKSLQKSHYGMVKVKAKILEYVAAKKRNPSIDSPVLCLIGPSGVGKTTFAKSVAKSLHKEFYKISVGGINDSSILNGHRRTYLGANPGKIIEGLKKCGTNNPLILIDEVDKMVKDYHGDPASVLLDILDKSQNKTFIDNYIEEEFDLSNVFFLLTANTASDIPLELYDRLEIIELSSYTLFEKIEIAKKYLLPLIYKEHKLHAKNIKFSESILKEIILCYTKEAGVRDLKRILTSIVRKLLILENIEDIRITKEILTNLLGLEKYEKTHLLSPNFPGVINALGVNTFGGKVLPIETALFEGNGNVRVTGLVEKVMDESIKVAISYILTHKLDLGLENFDFKSYNYHIHILDAATKKDGPSAGLALTTSLISLGKDFPISSKIAMTGEISLNGMVRKIGGLKEKLIGAYHAGILKVFIPQENHNDLEEIPKEILKKLDIVEVYHYKEVYNALFVIGK